MHTFPRPPKVKLVVGPRHPLGRLASCELLRLHEAGVPVAAAAALGQLTAMLRTDRPAAAMVDQRPQVLASAIADRACEVVERDECAVGGPDVPRWRICWLEVGDIGPGSGPFIEAHTRAEVNPADLRYLDVPMVWVRARFTGPGYDPGTPPALDRV